MLYPCGGEREREPILEEREGANIGGRQPVVGCVT